MTGGEDNRRAAAAQHTATGKCDIRTFEQRPFRRCAGHRLRAGFASQRCVVDEQFFAFDEPSVGWNPVALANQHDISRHELVGRQLLFQAAPPHAHPLWQELPQLFHRPFGAHFLGKRKQGVQHGHAQQRPSKHRHPFARLNRLGDETDGRRDIEQDAEEVDEVLNERLDPAQPRRRPQSVWADFTKARGNFRVGQPFRAASQKAEHGVRGNFMDLPGRGVHWTPR